MFDMYSTGSPSQNGRLGYYGLLEWWSSIMSEQERLYIIEKYKPMGDSGNLIHGKIEGSSASVISFLTGLQSWFNNLSDEAISEKILNKAESLISSKISILDIHFLYGSLIEHYYKKRKIDHAFYELAKHYCKKQIEIAEDVIIAFTFKYNTSLIPSHKGLEQLAIILEKERKYEEALIICLKGKEMGWNYDWNKRITNLQTKLNTG